MQQRALAGLVGVVLGLAILVPTPAVAQATRVERPVAEGTLLNTAPVAAQTSSREALVSYKDAVARRVSDVNKLRITKAAYRSLTVVGYTIDGEGAVTDTWIVRSSGDSKLDEQAVKAFKAAEPLPKPPAGVFGEHLVASFSEAFIHAADGTLRVQALIK